MAIVETAGLVEYLKVASDWGFVNIRREEASGPRNELFIIWFYEDSEGPAALLTTELSLALARNFRVVVSHEEDSAYITQLRIDGQLP